MDEIKNLQDSLEQLKKEVWHIAKVSIPGFNSLGAALPEKIAAIENNINTLSNDLSSVKSSFNNNKINIDTSINNLNNNMGALKQDLSRLTSQVTDNTNATSQNTSDITTNTSQINELSGNMSELASNFGDLSVLITLNSQDIESINSSINTLQSQIDQLKNGSAAITGGTVDVIYDMTSSDTNINKGFTSGLKCDEQISHDLSPYKKIVVYGSLNRNDAVATSYFETRKNTDITLHNASILLDKVWFLKITIPAGKNKIVVNKLACYSADTTTGAVTFTRLNADPLFYVYRVEGIR